LYEVMIRLTTGEADKQAFAGLLRAHHRLQ
jgi:hypothetical protein